MWTYCPGSGSIVKYIARMKSSVKHTFAASAKALTIKQLRYVVAVSRTGSIAQAAESHAISVSSVREAIAFAEAKLRVHLFRRTPSKGMTLTAEGQRFVALTEQFLASHDVFERAASRIPLEWDNELRLGVVATVGPLVVPALARILADRLPRTRFRFDEMTSEDVSTRVREGALLGGLTFNDCLDTSLAFVELMRTPPYIAVARNHRLAERRSVKLEELHDEPYILLDFPGARAYYTGLFENDGVKPSLRYVAASREMAVELVGAGLGYSIFNMLPLAETDNRISRVPLRSDYWSPSFGLVYDRINTQMPMLTLLLTAVEKMKSEFKAIATPRRRPAPVQ